MLVEKIHAFETLLRGTPFEAVEAPLPQKDPTRLVLTTRKQGVSGYSALKYLQSQGIWAEMADAGHVVLICTPADSENDFDCLFQALSGMPAGHEKPVAVTQPQHGALRVSPRCANYGTMVLCQLSRASHRVAARAVCCYPPGVAIILPGEKITAEQVDYLLTMEAAGAMLVNVENGNVYVLPEE